MLQKIQTGRFMRCCCSYLSTELGINQWPLTLEKCCDWWREDSDRDSLWQIPCDWYVHHSWLQSKSQRLHHLMSEKQFAKRWERHFNLLEASLLSEHKCVTAFLIGARAGLNLPGPYFFCSDIYCPKLSHFSLPEHTPKITKFGINLPKNVISIVVLNFHH